MTIIAIVAAVVLIVVLLTAVAWRFCHRESKTQQQQGQGTGTTSDPEFDALVPTPTAPPADALRLPEVIPIGQGTVRAEIDGDVLPEGNPPTSGPNNDDGRQLSEYIAELARKQEALAEQRAELSRRQGDLQQELEEARRRQRDADTETETELEAESPESPESPGSSPDELKVVARAVLYL